jgi:hypothetical protein
MAMSHQLDFEQLLSYDPGRPGIIIDVTLQVNTGSVACQARVDTGSAFCIFSRKVGEDLGVDVEKGIRRTVATVTGTFPIYLHEVNLSAAGYSFSVLAGFAERGGFERNVLGRHGFLEQVTMGLVDYEGKLYLNRYSD